MFKIGVLASGDLGYQTLLGTKSKMEPVFIATDLHSKNIQQYAKEKGIRLFVGNPRSGKLLAFLANHRFDIFVSINYLFIVESDVLALTNYAINFHGSLLPKYRGRTPHVWAIINNEKYTGVSAHIMDAKCDAGDIISQNRVLIEEKDTGASMLLKFADIYPDMVLDIVNKAKLNKMSLIKQDETLATYFGQRRPQDGLINWNWQRERINNWVRAQAFPYPGAFTLISNHKITIDEVRYSDHGYRFDQPNGMVLNVGQYLTVKTPNGALNLTKIRKVDDIIINKWDVFS
jgi:methionyl-tRNA formyltransferase